MSSPGDSGPNYRDYIEAARTRAPGREALSAIARRVEEQVKAPVEPARAASSTLRISAAVLGGALVLALVIVVAPREEPPARLPESPSLPDSTREPSIVPDGSALDRSAPRSEPDPSDEVAPPSESPEPEERSPRPRLHRNASRHSEEGESRGTSEIALIEAAEAALSVRPQRALELVTAHERAFPRGAFVEEREVIAVDALSRIGRIEAAHARAERFRRQHPESAYTRRLDRILARLPAEGAP